MNALRRPAGSAIGTVVNRTFLGAVVLGLLLAACTAPPTAGEGAVAAAASQVERGRVVFFGDSITALWPDVMPAFFARHGYVGRGRVGQTTAQMLERFDRDVIEAKPSVVVILAGTNDIAGSNPPYDDAPIRANLRAMTERAQTHGIRVVLASLLPVRDYPWRHGLDPAPRVVALNAWIKEYAARVGAVYLDYFSAMADAENGLRADLGRDSVHPNLAGYQVMAPLAQRAIETALARHGPVLP